MSRVLVLHPGAMGASLVAAFALHHDVVAVSAGRSEATLSRARDAGATLVADLAEGLDGTDLVVSVCPPASAVDVARTVAAHDYRGVYLDANAVAPATVRAVADTVAEAHVVDGGIIGPPAWRAGTTRLALSGEGAQDIAAMVDGTPLQPVVAGTEVGAASALKLAYAAWTKGSAALLMSVAAFAEREGVMDELRDEWGRSQPGLAERLDGSSASTAPKAWRFVGEMEEIASAFGEQGLPRGFHEGAAQLYEMLAGFRDQAPTGVEVAAALADVRT